VEAGVLVVWVMVHAQVKRRQEEAAEVAEGAGGSKASTGALSALVDHPEEAGGSALELEHGGRQE